MHLYCRYALVQWGWCFLGCQKCQCGKTSATVRKKRCFRFSRFTVDMVSAGLLTHERAHLNVDMQPITWGTMLWQTKCLVWTQKRGLNLKGAGFVSFTEPLFLSNISSLRAELFNSTTPLICSLHWQFCHTFTFSWNAISFPFPSVFLPSPRLYSVLTLMPAHLI